MNIRQEQTFLCTEDYPIVETAAGKVHGFVDGDVFCFRGMEYAQAERFQEPRPVKPWEGVKKAFDYSYGCPEMTYSLQGKEPGGSLMIAQRFWHMSEHVQNLNVWTKSIDKEAKRPVMVWMHGGGYAAGSATHLYSYEGWEMAHAYDVVVVTVNHRLNMLGFLDLSAFGERYRHSGNLGMADLVAALHWVRDNIASFGGDPDNVTIYGQSGGGGKVTTLMQMPAADGLYHKVIAQSGVMRMGPDSSRAGELAQKAVANLGLTPQTIQEIETVPYEKLSAAVQQAAQELGLPPFGAWAPVPDGDYYVGNAFDVGFRKETAHIPMIVGSCLSEFDSSPVGDKSRWTDDQRKAVVEARFGSEAGRVMEAYANAYPEVDVSYAAAVDRRVRPAVLEFTALRNRDAKAPVFNYIFAFESTFLGGQLPGHNGDLHFMFHNAFGQEAMRKEGVTGPLQDAMAGAWAAFAETGSPNGPGLPQWEPHTAEKPTTMLYGDHSHQVVGHDAELMEVLAALPKPLVI